MPINNKTFMCVTFYPFFTPTTFGSFGYTSHLSTLKFRFLRNCATNSCASFVFLAGGAGVSKRINVFVSSSNSFFVDQSVLIAVQLLHSSLIPFAYVVCSQLYFHKKETVYNFTVSKLITIINSLFLLSLSFQYALSYSLISCRTVKQ